MLGCTYWNSLQLQGTVCQRCGVWWCGYHQCTTSSWPPANPDQRISDADVERIARRVVELMAAKRFAEV